MDIPKMKDKQPCSLYKQCLDFIANNVEIVESFAGFPSQIGEQIFQRCLTKKKFMDQDLTSLSLFTCEFGEEVLNSLNLAGEYLCLNYYLEQFLLLTSLVQLDVSKCGLGDTHEILAQFTNMTSLKILNLHGNSISTGGIQRMTTPYRMLGRGPGGLELLDVSDNPEVSSKVLKYLSPFHHLTVVLNCDLPYKLWEHKNWQMTRESSQRKHYIETRGWATSLIEEWKTKVKTKKSHTKTKQPFYKKPAPLADYKTDQKRENNGIVIAINRIREAQQQQQQQQQSSNIPKAKEDTVGVIVKPRNSSLIKAGVTRLCNNTNGMLNDEEDNQSLISLYGGARSKIKDNNINSASALDQIHRKGNSPNINHANRIPGNEDEHQTLISLYGSTSSNNTDNIVSSCSTLVQIHRKGNSPNINHPKRIPDNEDEDQSLISLYGGTNRSSNNVVNNGSVLDHIDLDRKGNSCEKNSSSLHLLNKSHNKTLKVWGRLPSNNNLVTKLSDRTTDKSESKENSNSESKSIMQYFKSITQLKAGLPEERIIICTTKPCNDITDDSHCSLKKSLKVQIKHRNNQNIDGDEDVNKTLKLIKPTNVEGTSESSDKRQSRKRKRIVISRQNLGEDNTDIEGFGETKSKYQKLGLSASVRQSSSIDHVEQTKCKAKPSFLECLDKY